MNNRLFSRDPERQIPFPVFRVKVGVASVGAPNGVELELALPFLSASPLLREGFWDL